MTRAWTEAPLAELADINPRGGATSPDALVSFVPMAALDAATAAAVDGEARPFHAVAKGYSQFRRGDLLVAKITPCFENGKIGRAMISRERGAGSTEFHVIRPDASQLDPSYALHFLRSPAVRRRGQLRMTGSGGQRRVPEQFLATLGVPLPPLPEQRRIARLLDAADALRAMRAQALERVDRLAAALFIAAFGERAGRSSQWSSRQLGEVVDLHAGGTLPAGEPFAGQDGGTLLMKVADMNAASNRRAITACALWTDGATSKATTCPPGAIVFPKRGAAIATNKKRLTTRPTALDPNLMGVAPDERQVTAAYLFGWFSRLDLRTITSGTSVPQLNKQDLAPLSILLPPLDRQRAFEQRQLALDRVRVAGEQQLVALERLFGSLQQRAFAGTL